MCGILSSKGEETITTSTQQKRLKRYLRTFSYLITPNATTEKKKRKEEYLLTWMWVKTPIWKKDKKSHSFSFKESLWAGLLKTEYLLLSVCALCVNVVEKQPYIRPDRDISRKYIEREIMWHWKKGKMAENPVPVPSRVWRSAARSFSSLDGGMCWRGWDRCNAPGTGGSSRAAAGSPSLS